MERAITRANRVAVLSFNLLGRQAETKNVDWPWVERTLLDLEKAGPSAEAKLFRARFDELNSKSTPTVTIEAYRAVASQTPADAVFTWTGVKYAARIDSYFDPFGNLTIRQRAAVELARILRKTGAVAEASRILDQLKGELGPRKARQLDAYASDYILILGEPAHKR